MVVSGRDRQLNDTHTATHHTGLVLVQVIVGHTTAAQPVCPPPPPPPPRPGQSVQMEELLTVHLLTCSSVCMLFSLLSLLITSAPPTNPSYQILQICCYSFIITTIIPVLYWRNMARVIKHRGRVHSVNPTRHAFNNSSKIK